MQQEVTTLENLQNNAVARNQEVNLEEQLQKEIKHLRGQCERLTLEVDQHSESRGSVELQPNILIKLKCFYFSSTRRNKRRILQKYIYWTKTTFFAWFPDRKAHQSTKRTSSTAPASPGPGILSRLRRSQVELSHVHIPKSSVVRQVWTVWNAPNFTWYEPKPWSSTCFQNGQAFRTKRSLYRFPSITQPAHDTLPAKSFTIRK